MKARRADSQFATGLRIADTLGVENLQFATRQIAPHYWKLLTFNNVLIAEGGNLGLAPLLLLGSEGPVAFLSARLVRGRTFQS
jgi:hypothetical protein